MLHISDHIIKAARLETDKRRLQIELPVMAMKKYIHDYRDNLLGYRSVLDRHQARQSLRKQISYANRVHTNQSTGSLAHTHTHNDMREKVKNLESNTATMCSQLVAGVRSNISDVCAQ